MLGSTLLKYDLLPSTNELAREMAAAGAEEGVAIIAYEQTAGRGRQGRSWSSPAGEGLYLSVILRPELAPGRAAIITLAAAVAVAETLALDFNIAPDIKWPNDVLASGKKICGILVESAIESGEIAYAVMGIGVNLGQRVFPEEIKHTATSLLLESDRRVTADEFAGPLLGRLDGWYRAAARRPAEVLARWEQLSSYAHGREVRVLSGGVTIEGVTRGITSAGALVLELGNGERREIVSGEVSLRAGDD
ncbi:MAG TPA: biotin--[acetyl-CoA-carboxylase] ligase [Blastocatellia bacterium]|jgi:BirA family biotin operon repressor/biotin-[acetyl-CoA-carboxylase] ligase